MSEPILYAGVAMVCYGLSDFIDKQAAAAGIRADHFLTDPVLYARALGAVPVGSERPVSTARVTR